MCVLFGLNALYSLNFGIVASFNTFQKVNKGLWIRYNVKLWMSSVDFCADGEKMTIIYRTKKVFKNIFLIFLKTSNTQYYNILVNFFHIFLLDKISSSKKTVQDTLLLWALSLVYHKNPWLKWSKYRMIFLSMYISNYCVWKSLVWRGPHKLLIFGFEKATWKMCRNFTMSY
jgi:hypothetical protein